GERPQTVTRAPASASTAAKVVPQLPVPSTATRVAPSSASVIAATLVPATARCAAPGRLGGQLLGAWVPVAAGVVGTGRGLRAAHLDEHRGDRRHDALG